MDTTFEKFKSLEELDHHYDEEQKIHYIVMNKQDNKATVPWLKKFISLIDKVEDTKGPDCLVTVATGPKIYHTGFDLDEWVQNPIQQHEAFILFNQLAARIMTCNVPTMTVVNGHAFAGGLLFALAHDHRIMRTDYGFTCLSELNIDFPLPEQYGDILRATLPPETVRHMLYGFRYNGQKSLEMKIVNQLYQDRQDMFNQILGFKKDYGPKGLFRQSVKDAKTNVYKDVINKLLLNPVSLQFVRKIASMKKP
ncbi:enoyl-hydratase [Stylonychia lemnae]|uniref:Enoyl-hydratase n=1 Tax=Stylonychia lemnae TaxID=5949 RepID=A0A078A517_STYLE|nr:enoyl-hydratase [Stylonychia lemnae]|eukprot:CDW77360.1 enoyl-hydratase [Stylonychia lemnae]